MMAYCVYIAVTRLYLHLCHIYLLITAYKLRKILIINVYIVQ